jgi:hypothetical protein
MISSSHGQPADAFTPARPKILGRLGVGRCCEPANILALSLECLARIVSGSDETGHLLQGLLGFWPISVSVSRSPSLSCMPL